MADIKAWILLGMASAAIGCADAGKSKGKSMEDPIDQLVSGYADLYAAPSDERRMELEDKVADMEWEGLFLAAPAVVEESNPVIPVLSVSRRSSLREWEVEFKENAFVLFSDLDRGTIGIRRLRKPPSKPMKPQPKVKGRKPDAGEGYRTAVDRYLVGESLSEPLQPGEYVVAIFYFDHLSNRRRIKKTGTPKPRESAVALSQWPWDRWNDTKSFTAAPDSPTLDGSAEVAVMVSGAKTERKIAGALAAKARPVHLIPPDPKRAAYAGIQAGIHVDLLLFTLDHPPKVVRVDVPILGSAHIKAGDAIKGWFNLPFPFQPSAEDRMLYAVADGMVFGPIKVPGEKP